MFKKKMEIPVWLWALMMFVIATHLVWGFVGTPSARLVAARADDLERVLCANAARELGVEDVFLACIHPGNDHAEGRRRLADEALEGLRESQQVIEELNRLDGHDRTPRRGATILPGPSGVPIILPR